jgi:hypothetical protein
LEGGAVRVLAVVGSKNASTAQRSSASPIFVDFRVRDCSLWRMCETSKRPNPAREIALERTWRRVADKERAR